MEYTPGYSINQGGGQMATIFWSLHRTEPAGVTHICQVCEPGGPRRWVPAMAHGGEARCEIRICKIATEAHTNPLQRQRRASLVLATWLLNCDAF